MKNWNPFKALETKEFETPKEIVEQMGFDPEATRQYDELATPKEGYTPTPAHLKKMIEGRANAKAERIRLGTEPQKKKLSKRVRRKRAEVNYKSGLKRKIKDGRLTLEQAQVRLAKYIEDRKPGSSTTKRMAMPNSRPIAQGDFSIVVTLTNRERGRVKSIAKKLGVTEKELIAFTLREFLPVVEEKASSTLHFND
jgi:hypothetical protein